MFASFLFVSLVLMGWAQTAAPTVNYAEIVRKRHRYGDVTVTTVLVQPPILPKAAPRPPQPAPTAEEQATAERRAKKAFESLTVSGTVYLGGRTVTELTWTIEDKQYRALSNVDFRLFTQMLDVETEDTVFSWFPMIVAVPDTPDANLPTAALARLPRNDSEADFVFMGAKEDLKVNEKALDLLDYLHVYYEHHRTELVVDFNRREAEQRERERQEAAKPKPNPTLFFWFSTPAKTP